MAIASASSSVVEAHQRQHRPEHLDLAELAVRVDVAEHGRLDVEAVGQVAAGDAAAERAAWPVPSAWARSIIAEDALLGRPADDRAHAGGGIERVAEGDVAGERDDLLGELVVDAVVHDEPGGRARSPVRRGSGGPTRWR